MSTAAVAAPGSQAGILSLDQVQYELLVTK